MAVVALVMVAVRPASSATAIVRRVVVVVAVAVVIATIAIATVVVVVIAIVIATSATTAVVVAVAAAAVATERTLRSLRCTTLTLGAESTLRARRAFSSRVGPLILPAAPTSALLATLRGR